MRVNDVELFVEEIGTGTPILVLHGGLGLDHRYLRPDFDRLSDRGRIVYVDHRGNGRSGRTDAPLTVEQLAEDAAAVIHGVGGPATVIGHSYGGFVAQELALRHPETVARIVLVSTTPGQLGDADDPDADQGPPPPPALADAFAIDIDDDDAYRTQLAAFAPFFSVSEPEEALARLAPVRVDARARNEGFASLAEWSVVDRLGTLSVPVLVVGADQDHLTSPQQATRIGRLIPDAEVHICAQSGHFPWLDRPEQFWSVVESWLDRTE